MRVAIVNDLALAREVLRRLVLSVPGYAVAWTAADGAEAVRRAAADRPDAILMDLVMPALDGVEATRRIMAESPCPILLVTSSVCGNFNKVYEAMGHGGLDAVDTPTLAPDGTVRNGDGLVARLRKIEQAHVAAPLCHVEVPAVPGGGRPAAGPQPPLVALGASTGGPEALARVLAALPADLPAAVVVAQHIGAEFAPSLAAWLQGRTRLRVRLATPGDALVPGEVRLAATDDHLVVDAGGRLACTREPASCPYRPSVDALFLSLAAHWPRPGVAALLTGMGTDGARGLGCLREAGWLTLAQDQATSVVYGMPQAAARLGAAARVLPLPDIAGAIVAHLGPGGERAPAGPPARDRKA
jgi:two-component system response regulator WspF